MAPSQNAEGIKWGGGNPNNVGRMKFTPKNSMEA